MSEMTFSKKVSLVAFFFVLALIGGALISPSSSDATSPVFQSKCDNGNRVYYRGSEGIAVVPRDEGCVVVVPTPTATPTPRPTVPVPTTQAPTEHPTPSPTDPPAGG